MEPSCVLRAVITWQICKHKRRICWGFFGTPAVEVVISRVWNNTVPNRVVSVTGSRLSQLIKKLGLKDDHGSIEHPKSIVFVY
jgi:hypothetical protein